MMGKLQMDREWTEQDLRTFAEGAQAAFETVLLDELPQDTGWQDEGLQVSYSLCNGRVSCVLHRTVRADGKLWRITMSAPLAGNLLLVGSIANLIVADLAARQGITIDWKTHARIGIPVTLLTLAVVAGWL